MEKGTNEKAYLSTAAATLRLVYKSNVSMSTNEGNDQQVTKTHVQYSLVKGEEEE